MKILLMAFLFFQRLDPSENPRFGDVFSECVNRYAEARFDRPMEYLGQRRSRSGLFFFGDTLHLGNAFQVD
jgi:hypothetical protein